MQTIYHLPLPASPLTTDLDPELVALLSTSPVSVTAGEFEDASSSCSELASLRVQIHQQWPVSVKAVEPILQPYFKIRHELSVKDSLAFRGTRLVVPISLRHTLISLAHEGHQGIGHPKTALARVVLVPWNGYAGTFANICMLSVSKLRQDCKGF